MWGGRQRCTERRATTRARISEKGSWPLRSASPEPDIDERCLTIPTLSVSQDNDVEREAAIHRTEGDYARAEFWKWFLAAAIGAAMGTLAFLVDWGIDTLNDAKFQLVTERIMTDGALLLLCSAAREMVGVPSALAATGRWPSSLTGALTR